MTKKEELLLWNKRRTEILKFRESGMTLEQIGKIFNVTRQRIFQCIKKFKLVDKIKNRDNNCCAICFKKDKLNIHHIDCNTDNNKEKNLITLCYKCHVKVHTIMRKSKGLDKINK
jgi:predicted DNA-binding protein YlxM (UPF0122 family)